MTWRFGTLFVRQALRPAWRHPLLALLNLLSIALGVAVFIAVQTANQGAVDSFRSAVALTTGKADLEVRGDIPEQVFPAIAALPGIRAATPLVEGVVTIPGVPGEYLRILGVDPFSGSDLFAFQLEEKSGQRLDIERWLREPTAFAWQPERAKALQPFLKDGLLTVLAAGQRRQLRPSFLFQPNSTLARGETHIAAMDIGWAQELLGQGGRLSSIQILLENKAESDSVATAIERLVPADVIVGLPHSRSTEMEAMLGAFQLNLTALSLVSLLVGMLLIYNSVSTAVARRRTEIAILRACGTTRWEVRLLFLGEAAVLAILGASLGLLFAPVLVHIVSTPIESSISNLYALVRIDHFAITPWLIAEAFGLGLGAALFAAWLPASEAAASEPAHILHPGAGMERRPPLKARGLVIAAIFLGAAWALSVRALHGGPAGLAFAAAALIILGYSWLVPWLATGIAMSFRHGGVLWRQASDHLVRSLHRNTMTISSLAAALAMTVSVTVMIHSFRESVDRWIQHTLLADLYVSPASNDVAGFQSFVPLGAVDWWKEQPEVRDVTAFRDMPVRVNGKPTILTVVEGRGRGDLDFLPGTPRDAAELFTSGQAIAVSESFATRFPLNSDHTIKLPTPKGEITLPVCGVFRDYTSDRGVIMMANKLARNYWEGEKWHSLGVVLKDKSTTDAMAQRFREKYGAQGEFVIYNNAALRARVFEIFNQTFAVTSVLRGIAVIVAVIGVLFSLSVLVLERRREIGVLRALGSSRGQVLAIFLGEAGLIALSACLSGLASGGALALVLTWVVNKAFFGWTIDLSFPVGALVATPLWLIPAALIAALLPAWQAARTQPAEAIRFE
jgi:putative ABC transport system permease protein